jgi:hypothetical protein
MLPHFYARYFIIIQTFSHARRIIEGLLKEGKHALPPAFALTFPCFN